MKHLLLYKGNETKNINFFRETNMTYNKDWSSIDGKLDIKHSPSNRKTLSSKFIQKILF